MRKLASIFLVALFTWTSVSLAQAEEPSAAADRFYNEYMSMGVAFLCPSRTSSKSRVWTATLQHSDPGEQACSGGKFITLVGGATATWPLCDGRLFDIGETS
jgi:hypothetical protein